MTLHKPKFPAPFGRAGRRAGRDPAVARPRVADESAPTPAGGLDDEQAAAESAEAGWRASSYDLKHGLDVVELPASLPADVLDRLFDALRR
jgi:hypothetical protein